MPCKEGAEPALVSDTLAASFMLAQLNRFQSTVWTWLILI